MTVVPESGRPAAWSSLRLRGVRARLRNVRRVPLIVMLAGVAIVLANLVMAFAAPLLAPFGFATYEDGGQPFGYLEGPSWAHPFGTTSVGTDVLSRVIYGSRTALEVSIVSLAVAITVGVLLGLLSGYLGGPLDKAMVVVMDALFGVPYLLVAVVASFLLSGTIGKGIGAAALAIAVVFIPQYFRVIRNQVQTVRELPYVEAARALGAPSRTIIARYVTLNVIQTVPVIATLNAADAIITLAGLGFLGYGVSPTEASEWGYDLQRAMNDISVGAWWTGLFPGLALVVLACGFTLLGEGLNDAFNPVLARRRVLRRKPGSTNG